MDKLNNPVETALPQKKIRHLVLSGGGGTGFAFYGALRESHKDGFWNINDIQTMHGVSGGAIFIILIATLKHIDWSDFDDFCIKRPWETVFDFSTEKMLNAYTNVGIFDRYVCLDIISPVLKAVDLPTDVNLQQFYEFTGIELHFYTTNFNTYELVDVSYKTHPEWTLVDALYCSCALPLLFRPSIVDGVCYVDGGILCNYPLNQCLQVALDPDEILGMNKGSPVELVTPEAPTYANIMEYLADIILKTTRKISIQPIKIAYTLEFCDGITNALTVFNAIKTREARAAKIQMGVEVWNQFKNQHGILQGHLQSLHVSTD